MMKQHEWLLTKTLDGFVERKNGLKTDMSYYNAPEWRQEDWILLRPVVLVMLCRMT